MAINHINLGKTKEVTDLEMKIKNLEKQLQEYIKVEKVIIAAGLLEEHQFDRAREVVRSCE